MAMKTVEDLKALLKELVIARRDAAYAIADVDDDGGLEELVQFHQTIVALSAVIDGEGSPSVESMIA